MLVGPVLSVEVMKAGADVPTEDLGLEQQMEGWMRKPQGLCQQRQSFVHRIAE